MFCQRYIYIYIRDDFKKIQILQKENNCKISIGVPVNGARKHQQMKSTSNRALAYKNTDAGLIYFADQDLCIPSKQ